MTRGLGYLRSVAMIVGRSLRQHALSSLVTILSVGLAAGLVMSVFSVSRQSREAFAGGPVGFDAVLGARGSQLQLVLNTVFHLETSPGNIPWELYEEIAADPRVELAIPYAVGDHYEGFRIVGTDSRIFQDVEFGEDEAAVKPLAFTPNSRVFDEQRREAVIGSFAAQETGLGLGDLFHPTHGVDHAHEEDYVVVGVLEPTNTPADRVLWIPIEGIFRLDGHVLRGSGDEFVPEVGEEIDDHHKELSAVMLKLTSNRDGFFLGQEINGNRDDATLAFPISASVSQLFDKLVWVSKVLELVAYLVVVVAAGSILASLYNTMNERRREFAILRSLGARRRTVFAVILCESTFIALLGSVLGFACYFGILALAANVVRKEVGVALDIFAYHPAMLWTPLGMVVVGAISGLLPAFKAYSTDVADTLSRS
ncbi:MAG: putative ABC transport system permease protein [Bacteroidia bacterium]|jgi:putative ABC transport system permease protein